MNIEVYRGPGDRAGKPIVTPLLSDEMLMVRGRAEMNANAHSIVEHSGEIIFRPGMMLGQLVESPSITVSAPVRAKLVGISISIRLSDGADPTLMMDCHIKLRQPL